MNPNEETDEATKPSYRIIRRMGLHNQNLCGLENYTELQISIRDYFAIFSMN